MRLVLTGGGEREARDARKPGLLVGSGCMVVSFGVIRATLEVRGVGVYC